MRVRALKTGYYNLKRRREGEIFDMEEKHFMPKNESGQPYLIKGKPYSATWCEAVDAVEHQGKNKRRPEPVKEVSSDSEVI
jgi:hypothetical protein